jgi:branched-chain amino acid transport system ATP-binding protein
MSSRPLLEVRDLGVQYGNVIAVAGVALAVYEGEMVALIGANGAGKSSVLRAVSGMVPRAGRVLFDGADLGGLTPDRILAAGLAHVPEGRGIFGNLTVRENLELATWRRRDRAEIRADYERVYGIFPRLAERRKQLGGTLSGGEQQMLAVGRALMSRARMLLLDEPSMGLAPVLVAEIFRVLAELNRDGATLLVVEQNAHMALRAAHRGYVLENGRIVLSGPGAELLHNPRVQSAYLGG